MFKLSGLDFGLRCMVVVFMATAVPGLILGVGLCLVLLVWCFYFGLFVVLVVYDVCVGVLGFWLCAWDRFGDCSSLL